ncbi:MAG: outer membrane protein assembly factor BamA [Rhodobacterales bacterium]|nr:outer membrane protein assembly factor BamA [Rhodobacterales bacterium]
MLLLVLAAFAAPPAAPSALAQTSGGGIIRSIQVEGAQRIEPETVRSYLLVQEGDRFDPGRIDRSLKSLFATGLFADVSFQRRGDTLMVNVVENPVINRIAFEGNRHIEDDILDAEVTLRPRIIYTRTKVQNDVQRILTVYRRSGRFAATVEPKVIQLPQNRVDLVFEIKEGDVTEVRRIRFVGNREFSDSKLRDVIRTRESRWYRFFSSDDTYDPDRMTFDRELLRRFYMKEGFADVRILSSVAELTPDRKAFFLTYTLEEGARYAFGKIETTSILRGLESEQVQDVVELEEGDWYDADAVDDTVEDLTNRAGELGHAFVDVRPRVSRNRENRTIDVTFEVAEGPRIFVERIDITGNVRTIDDVIRREFKLVEGDAFNSARLRRSRQRINNLDFFEKVDIEQVPGSAPDKTVIKVDVQEKSTGSLSVGAGFSTTNGALADVGIEERNLLGRGQSLKVKVKVAQRQSEVDLAFTEPYFLDREVAAGFDLFHIRTDRQSESSFDTTSTGGSLRAGYPITDDLAQSWRYTFSITDVENVDPGASAYIRGQEGRRVLSEVSHILTYDKRDSRILPTEGYYVRGITDVAGLGGNARYVRNTIDGGKYFPLDDNWVLAFKGTAGYIVGIGGDVNIIDRFFVGGDDLRGFESGGVGPRDTRTDDALGGEWKYTATTELTFPLGLPDELAINGRVFTDIGSAGKISQSGPNISDTGSLRLSSGFGISWISPFGPIGLDIGFPIVKESFDREENIRINFGTRF